VGLALTAMLGIILADFFPASPGAWLPIGTIFVVAGLAIFRWPNLRSTYALIACGFFLLHGLQIKDTAGLWLAGELGERPRFVEATGSVVSEPKIASNGFATFLLKLKSIEFESKNLPASATWLVRWRGEPQFGDEFKFFGIAEPIPPPRNPGEFDIRSYLARQDVYRSLFVRYPEEGVLVGNGGGNPVLRAAQKSRAWMQSALCRGLDDSPDVQNFISGIVLGLRHQTPEDIEEPFQQTGTLHLFAVAGLHVGIVARLLWILAIVVQLSRKWAIALIIPLLLFYAAATGLHVSSVRAAVMSSILLGGFFFERKAFVFNSLAAAAFFLLCWSTNEFFSTGFQLSFAVVGGIILLADPLFRSLQRLGAADRFLPRSLLSGRRRALAIGWEWISRGLARFAAAYSMVFSSGHADFAVRKSHCCSNCFLHFGNRAVVDLNCAIAPVAVDCFQQRELVAGAACSRTRALVCAAFRRTLLRRAPALAGKDASQSCGARYRRWRGGTCADAQHGLAV
jgi:competence protein ComEC